MWFSVLLASVGLALLLGGGEVLLRGAISLAGRLGLSPLLIGLTVVAAATSMPELVVTVTSGLEGVPNLGVGNVVGSNIANTLLILGAAALAWPIATRPQFVLRDGAIMLAATTLFTVFALAGEVGRLQGTIMLALLLLYLGYSHHSERRPKNPGADRASAEQKEAEAEAKEAMSAPFVSLLLIAGGMGAMVGGSKLLVDGAIEIARALGVSDAVIGLTLVAIGTSLPELATAIIAGLRRHSEIALGNVLGSNLFNLLMILGALALTTPFRVAREMLVVDVWVMVGAALILLPVMFTGWRIGRWEGAAFLVAYAIYIASKYQPAAAAG